MVDQVQANDIANTTEPKTEALKPVGPTVEQLQAKIEAWEAKYAKEVGDRDRGNARLSKEVGDLREELKFTRKGTEALATLALGSEDIPAVETDKQKWTREYGNATQCERCEVMNKRYTWANISGHYKENRNDFIQLCYSCHKKYDLERKSSKH